MQYHKARDYGFPGRVEEAIERRSYPHRSRNAVGETPEPHYTIQDQFSINNYAFKGYGIDPKVPPKESCPFGRDPETTLPAHTTAQEAQQQTSSGAAPSPVRFEPTCQETNRISSAQYRTRIEPMSTPRVRTHIHQHQSTATQPPQESPAMVLRGQHASYRSGGQVAAVMSGYPVSTDGANEKRPSSRCDAPAGRPTSSSSQRGTGLFDKELSPHEMSLMLERCGTLFQSLQNTKTFDRVWLHASGGAVPAKLLSVATFRQSIDALGL